MILDRPGLLDEREVQTSLKFAICFPTFFVSLFENGRLNGSKVVLIID